MPIDPKYQHVYETMAALCIDLRAKELRLNADPRSRSKRIDVDRAQQLLSNYMDNNFSIAISVKMELLAKED